MKNLDLRIAGKYQLQRRIGGGTFGDVYIGTSLDNGEEVAIKLEHYGEGSDLLRYEIYYYQSLAGGVGIPRVHDQLFECDYRALVMELLGPSLEDLFKFCRRRFSLKTVLMLTDQLLHRLQFIHSRKFIHRDVTPSNFLMGSGKSGNLLYVTDLGLAIDRPRGHENIDLSDGAKRSLIGTADFASINGHLGILQGPCDDLESLGYMLLYFLRGSLPWQAIVAKDRVQEDELILAKKKAISTEDLCAGLPKEFSIYFDYIRSLCFNKTPAYAYLRKIFRNLFSREGFEYDHVFDWTILKYLMMEETSSKSSPDELSDEL